MSPSNDPSHLEGSRKTLTLAALRLSLSLAWKKRAAWMQRRSRANAQKIAALNRSFSEFLDLPSVWLERRRRQKMRREADKQYASLGTAPYLTPSARLGKNIRAWFAGIAGNRERLWRRTAGALGAVAALSILGNLLMYQRYSPARSLVTVGNRVVRQREYQGELEAAAGKSVLMKIVLSELIRQAAAKAGVTPTSAQIEARLVEMERHGMSVPAHADMDRLRQSISLALALENLRMQGLQASDAEITECYRKNAARLALPARVVSILVLTQSEFESQAATGLLAKGKTAAEVAAQPGMRVDGENGFHLNLDALPPVLHRTVVEKALAMQPGQITTLRIGDGFLTIQCRHKDAPSQPPLSQARDQVARMVKLNKALSGDAELALLYHANRPNFDMDRYAAYLDDLDHASPTAPPAVSNKVVPKTVGFP